MTSNVLLTISDFSRNVRAQEWLQSWWRRSDEGGDGATEEGDGRGNVSSLQFQAGKRSNSPRFNSGVSLWEKAERQKQTEKSKCKRHRMGGATDLWKTKVILPVWQILKNKLYFIVWETSAPLLVFHFGLRSSWRCPSVSGHQLTFRRLQAWLGVKSAGQAVFSGRWVVVLSVSWSLFLFDTHVIFYLKCHLVSPVTICQVAQRVVEMNPHTCPLWEQTSWVPLQRRCRHLSQSRLESLGLANSPVWAAGVSHQRYQLSICSLHVELSLSSNRLR